MRTLKIFTICLTTLYSVSIALAQTENETENTNSRPTSPCIFVKSDTDRLSCYDEESGIKLPSKAASIRSDWNVVTETSVLTDDKNVYISTNSKERIACGWASNSSTATLLVRCQENTTAIYLRTDCHVASSDYDNYGDITYRIDDLPAKTRGFSASSNNKALGLWSGGASIPFIKRLLGHDKLIMRFTPYSESPETVTFNIAGLNEKIKPLREACNW